MTKSAQKAGSRIPILEDVIKLADKVVRKCNKTKDLRGTRLWRVAYVARATATARAVLLLLEKDLGTETRILIRSLYDAVIDTLFIGQNPEHGTRIHRALVDEAIVDRYRHVEFLAVLDNGSSVAQYADKVPSARAVIAEYTRVKNQPAFQREKYELGLWERRWRDISAKQKLNALSEFPKAFRKFEYVMRAVGDAFAHNTPLALRGTMYPRRNGGLGVRTISEPIDYTETDEFCGFLACLLLLIICGHTICDLFLSKRLKDEVQSIMDRLVAAGKEFPIQDAMPPGKRKGWI